MSTLQTDFPKPVTPGSKGSYGASNRPARADHEHPFPDSFLAGLNEALALAKTLSGSSLATLANGLVTEQQARQAADAAETSARVAADGALAVDLAAEVAARIAADSTLTTAISDEEAARIAADISLAGIISAEAATRAAADTALSGSIAAEAATRAAADTALSGSISAEAATRAADDATEAAARAAADALLVPKTTQVIAGTGLTGGGALSANVTLTVSYGSSAGTACEGNDARLSNARTPTAHAASHAAGGGDDLTLTEAQITGLVSDLAAKALAGAVGSSGITMSTARLLGRTSASTGVVEEITVGAGLSLSGGALSATGGTATAPDLPISVGWFLS